MREAVFQMCFALEHGTEDMLALIQKELKINKTDARSALARATAVMEKAPEMDVLIEQTATEYALDRIPKAELTILRLGAFELLFDDAIPSKVAVSEAIRLCRKFATKESASFINAVLDAHIPEKSTT
ncbi:MAG: transcription antitermination factor NusB [Chlamydiia bacterium]|nr:transcription antitermination factor NusB [Chlamydiia bacterium]HPE84791.1 transcription antitermination factor NusB [Chlamydiales bacterium]